MASFQWLLSVIILDIRLPPIDQWRDKIGLKLKMRQCENVDKEERISTLGGEIMNLEELIMLESDELDNLLRQMSPQELDAMQAKVLKRMKEIREEIDLSLNNFAK
ncbi:MAG: hypothetical protein APF81_05335 [Desulfosporosinus sp. BRH_c37]|nr:MAG: hypothetical protein APF81_05335 [Desulfosporosinus sp. BRH_c37]